jgi:YedE family putative selenium metabolism protein
MLRGEEPRSRRLLGVALLALTGAAAAALVLAGNPGNMGLCGACFLRDLSGALRLHQGPAIFRPETLGLVLGALLWSFASGRHVGRSGSYAVSRFLLCVAMAFGALVFLGCPFRLLQRLGGGDLHAWAAAPGFVLGVAVARWFEGAGYSLGKTHETPRAVGLLGPLAFVALGVLFVGADALAGPGPGSDGKPPHAPWLLALGLALAAGAVLSATGFCAISAARQAFAGPRWMLAAAAALVAGYGIVLAAGGAANWSATAQPVAHGDWLWNTLALALVGLCGAFAGGCPVRQLVMAGEGNGDAFVGVAGLVVGGALAHGMGLAAAPATADAAGGPTAAGQRAVAIAIALVLVYATAMRGAKPAVG